MTVWAFGGFGFFCPCEAQAWLGVLVVWSGGEFDRWNRFRFWARIARRARSVIPARLVFSNLFMLLKITN